MCYNVELRAIASAILLILKGKAASNRMFFFVIKLHALKSLRDNFSVLVVALSLQACAPGTVYQADKNVALEEDDSKAIVVASVRGSSPAIDCATLNWQIYDREKEALTSESTAFIYTPGPSKDTIHMMRCAAPHIKEDPTDLTGRRYLVYAVKPGMYVLSQYSAYVADKYYTTRVKKKSVSFKVEEGELIYIGNFILDDAYDYNPGTGKNYGGGWTKFKFDGRDDREVAAFLAKEYPKLTNPLIYRKPEPFAYKAP